jgi:glycosyltransferase involved in cell wall biosynthesis
MTPRRFCMVTTFYPPYNFGGDGILVERLAHALAADGHEVHVVHDRDAFELVSGTTDDLPRPPRDGVTVHTIRRPRSARAELLLSHQLGRPSGAHKTIAEMLDRERFDVVHFHNVSLLGGPGLLRHGSGVTLCTMHDYWFVCGMHVLWRDDREACEKRRCLSCTLRGGKPPQLWRYTGSVARAARHVDAFIAPSRAACDLQARNGFPAPVECLPDFLPRQPLAEEGPVPVHPRPYFLFAGRLEKIKGAQNLIDAFRTERAADLVIAGTGPFEAELRAAAAGLPHVHFLGRLEFEALRRFYRQAIAVVVPSLCYETFGFPVIEAWASGTPVIVHDIGALPELVNEGGGGLIYRSGVELANALSRLRTDTTLRNELGGRGYERYLAEYCEEPHLRRYYALIERIERSRVAAN